MLKRRYFSVCASLLFFLALCIAPKVSAIETRSYLVTDFREFTQAPHRTIVWYHTYVYLPWKSGKVVLSGSPDGTKPVNIGWKIELINEKSNTRKFSYNNSDSIYTCVDVDMPPLNITHLFLEGDNGFLIRFVSPCYNANNRLDIGPVYIVHFDDYEPSDEPFFGFALGLCRRWREI